MTTPSQDKNDDDPRPDFERLVPHATDSRTWGSSASSSLLSEPLTIHDVTKFSIQQIETPAKTRGPQGATEDSQIDQETSNPEVGSKHQQVLESWSAIFGKAQTPRIRPTVPDRDTDIARRYRQQRIVHIDKDKPYGDKMTQKKNGLSRFYFINPNGTPTPRPLRFV
jgi:hypothetical protein